MEFASFEDDLFDDRRAKKELPAQTDAYVPKLEYPGWFLDDSDSGTDGDFLDKERMRANYFYFRRDYEKAAQMYDRLLQSTTSSVLQLEFTESYARSLMACNRFDDAQRISADFYKRASNYDQQLQALNLLSDLYWHGRDYRRCAVVSACLASMMDGGNADVWYRLGHCFLRWTDSESIGDQSGDLIDTLRLSVITPDSNSTPSTHTWFRKCLRRAHSLLWATHATSVGYARQRNEEMRQRIEADVRSVCGDEGLIDFDRHRRSDAKLESASTEQDDDSDQQSAGKGDLDKMLDDDLVVVFESFVHKWLV